MTIITASYVWCIIYGRRVSRSELQFSRVALLDCAAFFLDRHLEMNDANELSLFPGSLKKKFIPWCFHFVHCPLFSVVICVCLSSQTNWTSENVFTCTSLRCHVWLFQSSFGDWLYLGWVTQCVRVIPNGAEYKERVVPQCGKVGTPKE
jgi:hypothetical protein